MLADSDLGTCVQSAKEGVSNSSRHATTATTMRPPSRPATPTTEPAPTASQAADDDVEEGKDAVDDGEEDCGDCVDNGKDDVADRAEDGFEARDYGAHFDSVWCLKFELIEVYMYVNMYGFQSRR